MEVPPRTDIFFNLKSSDTNPSHSPFGEKNGQKAPSVPDMGVLSKVPSLRRYSCVLRSSPRAENTIAEPSGEIASGPVESAFSALLAGSVTDKCRGLTLRCHSPLCHTR